MSIELLGVASIALGACILAWTAVEVSMRKRLKLLRQAAEKARQERVRRALAELGASENDQEDEE
jgi:hypothetical protein